MAGRIIDATLRFVDKFTDPMNKATKQAQRMSRDIQNSGKSIQKTGQGISNVGSTLTKGVTLPLVGIASAAVKTASDFESQMSRVQAISGANKKELKQLEKQAISLGASSVYSASEAAQGMENMASAGFSTKEIMKAMPGMLNLAASSGEDLAASADIAASTVRGFGLSAGKTSHVADVLAKTAAATNAAVKDSGDAMKYAAPVAHALGISLEETSAAIGIMSNAGIKGSQAGTTIRGALTRLVKPTKQVYAGMDRLGIKFFDSHGKMKSLTKMTEELRNKTKGMTDKTKNQALAQIFGTEALSGMLSLVNSSPGELSKLTKSLKNSDGAATKMADTMMNNTKGAVEGMKGSLESAGIIVGKVFLPYVKKGAKKIGELADKFNGLSSEQQKSIIKHLAMVAAIGPGLMIFGKLVSGIGGTVKAFGKFGGAVSKGAKAFNSFAKVGSIGGKFAKFGNIGKAAFAAISSPAGIAVIAIAAIAVAAFLIIKNWTKVKAFLGKLGNYIKTIFQKSGGDTQKLGAAFQKVKKVIAVVVKAIPPILNIIIKVLKVILGFIGKVFVGQLKVGLAMAVGLFAGLLHGISGYIGGVKKIFSGIVTFVKGVFTGNWKQAWEGVKTIFGGVFQSLKSLALLPLNAVIGLINGAIAGINKLGIKIPSWVPKLGGKKFGINIPPMPFLAKGTNNWQGGLAVTQDGGGEIMDLPQGTRVYPHDKSVAMARAEGQKSAAPNINININKIADRVEFKNEGDMDKFVDKFANKLLSIAGNTGKAVPA